jgi:hypothetical protein
MNAPCVRDLGRLEGAPYLEPGESLELTAEGAALVLRHRRAGGQVSALRLSLPAGWGAATLLGAALERLLREMMSATRGEGGSA